MIMRNAVIVSAMVLTAVRFSLFADTISIKGTVVENGSTPLGQVMVFVKGQNLFDTTDAQGRFEFQKLIVASRENALKAWIISGVAFKNGILSYGIGSAQDIELSVFSSDGTRIATLDRGRKTRGSYHYNVAHNRSLKVMAAGLYCFQAVIGSTRLRTKLTVIDGAVSVGSLNSAMSVPAALGKGAAVDADTVMFAKDGYNSKSVGITSLIIDMGDVSLTSFSPVTSTPLKPVWYNGAKITSPFWKAAVKRMVTKWIPHCYGRLDTEEGHGIKLFINAGNKLNGQSFTVANQDPWANGYVHNTVEAMSMALTIDPQGDQEMITAQTAIKKKLDEWLPIILRAQESTGYLNTNYTLRNLTPWSNRNDHEGYIMGYFIEAACAHFLMSGKTDSTLYKAAKKCADYWVSKIGPSPKKTWWDGHEEIKLALVRLARLVDETEGKGKGDAYINLAKFLLDSRKGGTDYDQSQALPVLQTEAVGHAVRASYLYTGMTDIGISLKNQSCFDAAQKLWNSVTNYKMYVTGGIGSESSNEGFGPNYKLQNVSYDETCASCGMVFWANRMNCAFHNARYVDNLERQLYNVVLGSVDLAGQNFYYQNELDFSTPRYSWHGCPCCVGNIPRTLLSLVKWAYTTQGSDTVYVNLFLGSAVSIDNVAGAKVEFVQTSNYPWEGSTSIVVNPAATTAFTLKVRIPGFNESALYQTVPYSRTYNVSINGAAWSGLLDQGYATISRTWKAGDKVDVTIPMDIMRVHAIPAVWADTGKVAIARGPLIYNIEDVDNSQGAANCRLPATAALSATWKPDLLGGVMTINGTATKIGSTTSYPFQAIPNYARLNRGGRSIVWIQEH
jgi:DUF1680 family protein